MTGMTRNEPPWRGEETIVQDYLQPLASRWPGAFGLRDDCAAITPAPGHDLIVKTDPVRAGVHFFHDDAPCDVAWKALAVNVSDLAAKAARPLAYTLALSFPEMPDRTWLEGFSAGLSRAQQAFGCVLIGGDTDRAPGPVSASVTVFGEIAHGKMLQRGAAQPGDRLFVSGTLGDAALGLRLRAGEQVAGLSEDQRLILLHRYLRPQPRLGLRAALRAAASAAMDLSDGLAKDLGRMCNTSGVGATIRLADLPLSDALRSACMAAGQDARALVSSGDDYEILCAVPEAACAQFVSSARAGRVSVTEIGVINTANGTELIGLNNRPIDWGSSGYDHFSPLDTSD